MGFRHNIRRDNEGLSDQMKAFAHRYCVHFDRALAYQEVYKCDDLKKAKAGASGLFKKQKVVNYIDEILRERKNQTVDINVDELIKELQAIAMCRIDDVVDLTTGEILTVVKGDAMAAISEINVDEFESEAYSKRKKKVKLHSKLSAIDTLLKIAGVTSELASALRVLEVYGVKLKQDESGKWFIDDD